MKKLKQVTKLLITYLPDMLLLIGVAILFYNIFTPTDFQERVNMNIVSKYNTEYKTLGVVLIVFAIDIMARHYFNSKNKN